VVWDQDVRVIVMLTAESEGGQLKCHPYWTGKEFGAIRLRSLSEKKVSLDMDKHRSNSNATAYSSSPSSSTPQATTLGGDIGRRRANTTTTLEGSTPTPVQPTLTNNSQGETPYVIIRKFALSHAAHPFAPIREITHLHYPSWPDFGAPAQPSHLLGLVELANIMQRASMPMDGPYGNGQTASRSNSSVGLSSAPAWYDEPESDEHARPMLVHCSAGCGRTGTFCTVDSVIDMMKRQRVQEARRANAAAEAASQRVRAQRLIDDDGDVSMDGMATPEDEDAISPLTARQHVEHIEASASPSDSDERYLDTEWLDDDGVDIIARTVEDFRGQRLSMVQSLRQFVLCYETVLEWIWRLQERTNGGTRPTSTPGGGRRRSGSLQVSRTNS
jgi:tyrosine-protein phosphatase 2/3